GEVWRGVAPSRGGVPCEQSRDILLKLITRFDGLDRWYLEALGTGAAGNEDALYSAVLSAMRRPHPLPGDRRVAAIVWRLHPASSIDPLASRAGSSVLSA